MKNKPVKIVATLGPATYTKEMIFDLAKTGVDVFRINLAHATADEVARCTAWIREAEKELERPLSVMGDLPGPKIRIKDVKPDTYLTKGQNFTLSKKISTGDEKGCGINFPSIIDSLKVGAEVYIDDGEIKLVVEKKTPDGVITRILVGGHLKSKKGFSAEGIALNPVDVSEKDKECVVVLVKNNVDAIAISFVQTARNILEIRKLLPVKSKIMLIAKIETAKGVENAESILEAADGMMIARGDLGMAVPIAHVPHIQKQLIDVCVKQAKPVITATQMLESMVNKPVPTRAEVADVANAILDRTDAVMLSAETAEGKFPLEAVEMMVKVIAATISHITPYEYKEKRTIENAISDSVGKIADEVGAKLIVTFTESGATARRIARHRHSQIILAMSPDAAILRGLNFVWGVHPYHIANTKSFDDLLKQAKNLVTSNKVLSLEKEESYVISSGIPFGESGTTNMILVQKV